MKVTFNCERCGQVYEGNEVYLNKTFVCQTCDHSFVLLPVHEKKKLISVETILEDAGGFIRGLIIGFIVLAMVVAVVFNSSQSMLITNLLLLGVFSIPILKWCMETDPK